MQNKPQKITIESGVYFLSKEILQEAQKANYIFVKEPEFSNVRGYFNGTFN